jgi:hypothetical protein
MFSAIHLLSWRTVSRPLKRSVRCAHFFNTIEEWRIKELPRRTRVPAAVLLLKINACEVTKNTRHDNRAVAPLPEVEVELVVLNILIARNMILSHVVSITSGRTLSFHQQQ